MPPRIKPRLNINKVGAVEFVRVTKQVEGKRVTLMSFGQLSPLSRWKALRFIACYDIAEEQIRKIKYTKHSKLVFLLVFGEILGWENTTDLINEWRLASGLMAELQ